MKLITELIAVFFQFVVAVLCIGLLGCFAIVFGVVFLGVIAAAMVTSPVLLLVLKVAEWLQRRKSMKRKTKGRQKETAECAVNRCM